MKDKTQERAGSKRSKKAYHQPQLHVYGDLRGITQSTGKSAKTLDGAKMKIDKTH